MALVAGEARYFSRFFVVEEFFVYAIGHSHHVAGDQLMFVVIACEVKFARFAFYFGMAETALHTQGGFIALHDEREFILTDVLVEHFQIFILWFICSLET